MAAARKVTVSVPGSTSNCGSGFDTLGLALSVANTVTVGRLASPPAGGGGPAVPAAASDGAARAMADEAGAAFFTATGTPPFAFSFSIAGDVPPARGLGSSVTVIAGILAGLDILAGTGLSRHQLVALATVLEGHPDNASAGILGGFCVARCDPVTGDYRGCLRAEPPGTLSFVVVSPAGELRTKESRGALPSSLPYFDAVRAINASAYLVAAFMSGDYARLADVRGDLVHEPYRLPRIPGGSAAIAAGIGAGALTGWLSGSGSSVLCVCQGAGGAGVRAAMEGAFREAGVASEGRLLTADNAGLRVLAAD